MDLTLWLGFVIASASLALLPGPDNIYVLTESLAKGPKQGISITAGLISGVIVHTFFVATGVSLIITNELLLFNGIKLTGAFYLFYLAYGATKEQPMPLSAASNSKQAPWFGLMKRGFLMNVLNPKVTLFFLALLPQFVSPAAGWLPMHQMIVLGFTFMVISFVIFSTVALLAGSAARMIEKPTFWLATKWIKVAVLIGLGLYLIFGE